MLDTRRSFLKNLAGVSSSFLLLQSSPPMLTTRPRTPVDPLHCPLNCQTRTRP